EERNGVELNPMAVEIQAAGAVERVEIEGTVGEHDAFWRAGAAAGIEELRDLVFVVRSNVDGVRAAVANEVFVFGVEIDGSERRRAGVEKADGGRELRLIEQNFGFGVGDDGGELGTREAHVERHHDGADDGGAVIAFEKLVGVVAEVSDAVAGFNAGGFERGGE